MSGCKETICASCLHLEVCKLKETVLIAQTAVDDLLVDLGNEKTVYLRDIPWIPDVNLRCDHYVKKNQGGTIR